MTFERPLYDRAAAFLDACAAAKLHVGVAESCTGGLLAGLLTEVPDSSRVFEVGVVSYADSAKEEFLDVPAALLRQHGAVSAPVAVAMVAGIFAHSGADLGTAITGIAGPGGGSTDKPVGLVFIAAGRRNHPAVAHRFEFGDAGRATVRLNSVSAALGLLEQLL